MTGSAGSCTSTTDKCYGLNVSVTNFPVGSYTWSCSNNSGNYYNSTNKIRVSGANENFGDVNWCLNGYSNQTITITIDNVTSNGVAE
jgi:hypothetical protein